MSAILTGMEELRLFRTPQAREEAIASYADSLRLRDVAAGIVIVATVVTAVMFSIRFIASHFTQVMWMKDVAYLAALAAMVVTMRWLHHRGAARHVRDRLVKEGVPVCLGCGYPLAGLPRDARSCPECGEGISADASEILNVTSTVEAESRRS
jgi:hypothetical protein